MGAQAMRKAMTALQAANQAADEAISAIHTAARTIDPNDHEATDLLLEVAQVVGRCEQARHGQLIQLLAQADRVRASKGGLAPWITTHLDVTAGRSRAIAQSARRIGHLPVLARPLSSGGVGAETVRALTCAARAVEHTDRDQGAVLAATLELAASEGVGAANRQVRELEEAIDPGHGEEVLARQRKRSFARIVETENGMCRIEALLDPVRATTVRAAIDQQAAAWIRARQFDATDPLPEDVRSTEQIQAQALTRLAEVFFTADPAQREAAFTPATLYYAPLHDEIGLAESAYGVLVPRSVLAPVGDAAARLIEHRQGAPVLLDGQPIDTNPTTRLASFAQRIALAARDRYCTYPGCARPSTWSLHAHHRTPHAAGGPTAMHNLTLLCPHHHTLTHHPRPPR